MQSRNTAELRDVFSSLLRVFDIAAACAGILFFCARQKRLRQVPVPERCAAAALLFFLILQILSFSTEAESSQPPMRSENQKSGWEAITPEKPASFEAQKITMAKITP